MTPPRWWTGTGTCARPRSVTLRRGIASSPKSTERQAIKRSEGDLARELQRRVRGEEAANRLLEGERQALRDVQQAARQTERESCVISSRLKR